MLADILRRYEVRETVEVVFADVWHRIEVNQASIDIVKAVRAAGYGVHLATNQERHRGEYMKATLGYDDLFDVQCYSYEIGNAKPEPDFFAAAARRIQAPPDTILFIDDNERNVDAAIVSGMRAHQWEIADGHQALVDILAKHDIALDARSA